MILKMNDIARLRAISTDTWVGEKHKNGDIAGEIKRCEKC